MNQAHCVYCSKPYSNSIPPHFIDEETRAPFESHALQMTHMELLSMHFRIQTQGPSKPSTVTWGGKQSLSPSEPSHNPRGPSHSPQALYRPEMTQIPDIRHNSVSRGRQLVQKEQLISASKERTLDLKIWRQRGTLFTGRRYSLAQPIWKSMWRIP